MLSADKTADLTGRSDPRPGFWNDSLQDEKYDENGEEDENNYEDDGEDFANDQFSGKQSSNHDDFEDD